MPNLDLPSKYKNELLGIIEEIMPESEVWAYGSRITDNHHESSDLDLVIFNKTKSVEKLETLKTAIKNSNIPILIDLLDWDRIPDSFKHEIQSNHVNLFPQL